MMPKCDTIAAITKLNPSAGPEFLAEFSQDELAEYLRRLTKVCGVSASADALFRPEPEQGSDAHCITEPHTF